MSNITFETHPELFPTGAPKQRIPTPLEMLGDDTEDYSLELSGFDLSIVRQDGEKNTITLPSSGGGETPIIQTISTFENPIYTPFTDEVFTELHFDISDAEWGVETEMQMYMPAPTNYEVGAVIRLIDYAGTVEDGRQIILKRKYGENAYSFDNPNFGIDDVRFWGHLERRKSKLRVTSATTYEVI